MISLKEFLENYPASGDAQKQNAVPCNAMNILQTCSSATRGTEELGLCDDGLTGVLKRSCVECMIDARITAGIEFCVAAIEIDGLKDVQRAHGRMVCDELLNLFASELRSVCRSTDLIGRWSGDEFILLLDCNLSEGIGRMQRLSRWVCGDYSLRSQNRGMVKLRISASYGLVNHRRQESLEALVERALAAMNDQNAFRAGRALPAYAGLHI